MSRFRPLAAVLVCIALAVVAEPPAAGAASPTPELGPVTVVHESAHGCRAGLIALTFDDGPRPGTTARLVGILRHDDVPATFFEIGSHVRAHPALAQFVQRSGFAIGNHTWDHPVLTQLSSHRVLKEFRRTDASFREVGVRPPQLMRPPYGAVSRRVRKIARRLGLTTVLWTIDSNDWRGGNAHRIAHRVLHALRPHHTNIVLQHDGVTNSPASVSAVPIIVRTARARGYCFAALGSSGRPVPPVPAAVVTARNDDRPGSGSNVLLDVRLTKPTTRTVSLRLASQNVTALEGYDYTGFDLTVRIPAGQTKAVVRVPAVSGPAPCTFRVQVGEPRHLTLTGRSLDVRIDGDLRIPLFPELPTFARVGL